MLIEQFRLPALAAGIDPVLLEVPAGLCDAGEDPAATVVREAEEELGVPPGACCRSAISFSPGGWDERVSLHLGEDRPAGDRDGVVGLAGLQSEAEDIRARVWPAARAIVAALAGQRRTPSPPPPCSGSPRTAEAAGIVEDPP